MTVAAIRPGLLYAWRGPSLLITNARGECGPDEQLSGFYFREARYLRTLSLTINDRRPWLCEAATTDTTTLVLTFVFPEIEQPGGGGTGQSGDEEGRDADGIPHRSLDLRLTLTVRMASLEIALALANRAREAIACELAWSVGADFADIQEAQAGRREQESPVTTSTAETSVTFTYEHAALKFRTEVQHDDRWTFRNDRLVATLSLPPQHHEQLALRVVATDPRDAIPDDAGVEREEAAARWRRQFTRVESPASRVAEDVINRNIRDLASFASLDGPRDEWLALHAGVPLYPAFFGRDALTAGWQAGLVDRGDALEAALAKLQRLQSDRFDDWRDEQPGRVPYQVRSGPLALLNVNPYAAYYADYASPLMFVVSLANLWAWTGDRRRVERHWDAARRILDWAREHGDIDGDGYLEYDTRSPKGAKNQGWKDSGDAVTYADGTPVPAPIATCELQGYWYIAQELMALLSWVMGERENAAALRRSAAELKARFNRDWWMEDEHFIALALDPDKTQVRALTSNVGHCLASGIIDRDRLRAVVARMFAPDLFSGWGVRTLSTGHAFYNPLSYHRGSVWAVEQATIIFGLRRFGFDGRALDLTRALFDLASLYPEYRIPECVGGYARGESATPGAYPRANTPQLWNASAFPLIVQALAGLLPIAAAKTLIVDPMLPEWLPELVLRDVRVGEATVSLRMWRDERGACSWDVLDRKGSIHVIRQPPAESISASWTDRAAAVLESLFQ